MNNEASIAKSSAHIMLSGCSFGCGAPRETKQLTKQSQVYLYYLAREGPAGWCYLSESDFLRETASREEEI